MTATAFNERRDQDLRKLENLAEQSGGMIRVVSVSRNPISQIVVELRYKTASNKSYPREIFEKTQVQINLSSRYPFQEPSAVIKTKIFHPNVYSSGKICFGIKWLPTEGLDLLVKRIVQIITFDPAILNEKSPANGEALNWYRSTKSRSPDAFPTQPVRFPNFEEMKKIRWNDMESPQRPEKVVVSCPSCRGALRVPKGKLGKIRCPSCACLFEANTRCVG